MSKIYGVELEKPQRRSGVDVETRAAVHMEGTGEIPGPMDRGPGFEDTSDCKPAVFVEKGSINTDDSVSNAIFGGDIAPDKSKGLKVVAYDGITGGIHVCNSSHVAEDAVISLSGRGKGLAGRGTGASVCEHGDLTLKNAVIYTNGKARGCTAAEDHSVLRVYDSVLISMGAPYGDPNVPPVTGPAASPPPALEIEGNCRTHCTMSNSSSYFYNSRIITDGWAALSTDAARGYVYLEANHCQVVSTKSGYGIYADGGCHDVVRNCRFDTASMAAILGGESEVLFSKSNLNCGSYVALMHSVNGKDTEVGTVCLEHCKVSAKKDAFVVKSHNVEINLRQTELTVENGVLVRTMKNDDPIATKVGAVPVYGVNVFLSDMYVSGDLIHGDPERSMWVNLNSTCLKGAIQHAVIRFDTGSRWLATGNSVVTLIGYVEKGQIDALPGVTIQMKGKMEGNYNLPSGGTLMLIH